MSPSMNRRRLLQLGALAVVPSVLAGCGSGAGRSGSGDSGAVKFQGWDFESQLVQQNVDRFVDKAGIKVDYTPITSAQYVQKVTAQFTGGTEPDALYVYDDSLAAWIGAEYLQPIEGMPDLDKVYDAIYPGNAQTMTYDGKRYGLPYYTDSMALTYNVELLAKAGIKEPPKSLEEWEAQAKTLQDKGILEHPIGLSAQLSDTWWAWWWGLVFASGGKLFDDKMAPIMSTTDPVAKDVYAWMQQAATKSKVIDPASTTLLPIPLDNAFMAGKYAYILAARYGSRKYNDPKASKVAGKVKMALPPSIDGATEGTVSNTRMYCLSKNTEKKEDAYKLIYYLGGFDDTGDPYTARFWFEKQGLGFAFKDLASDAKIKEQLAKWADPAVYGHLAEVARPRRVIAEPWYTEYETETQKVIQQVLTGQSDPLAAVKKMADTAAALKKQYS